jgi:hypothetical protein
MGAKPAAAKEWSRLPSPLPHVWGFLVQPLRTATGYELMWHDAA